eukprot:1634527-Pleurochrysis_carterae.AAC.3
MSQVRWSASHAGATHASGDADGPVGRQDGSAPGSRSAKCLARDLLGICCATTHADDDIFHVCTAQDKEGQLAGLAALTSFYVLLRRII